MLTHNLTCELRVIFKRSLSWFLVIQARRKNKHCNHEITENNQWFIKRVLESLFSKIFTDQGPNCQQLLHKIIKNGGRLKRHHRIFSILTVVCFSSYSNHGKHWIIEYFLHVCLVFLFNPYFNKLSVSSVQSLSHVQLFVTPWIAACQASLSITNSRSLLKLMPMESVMQSSHLILCRPLLLLPPIPPSIRVFSNESTLHNR